MKVARGAAVSTLVRGLLAPLGHEGRGNEWRKRSRYGRSLLQLQCSRAGDRCYVNVGTRVPLGPGD